MANFFKDDLVDKIKTNPVMNQVFQDDPAMITYRAYENIYHDAVKNQWVADAPAGVLFTEKVSRAHPTAFSTYTWAEDHRSGARVLRDKAVQRFNQFDEGNLYWEQSLGSLPKKFVDIPTLNKPNPLVNDLLKTKISITNTFQSFSSK